MPPNKSIRKNKIKLIKEYYKGKTIIILAEEFGYCYKTLLHYFKTWNVDISLNKNKKRKCSNSFVNNIQIKQKVLKLIFKDKLMVKDVAKIFNIDAGYLSVVLNKFWKIKIPNRIRINNNNPNWRGYKNIGKKFWGDIKRHAESRHLKFDITIKEGYDLFVKQNKKCAISGIILILPECTECDRTASLDRIDSSKGYTIHNCQWVHKKINIIKQAMSDNEFIEWCHIISEYNIKNKSVRKKILNDKSRMKLMKNNRNND